jgi:hypothetical protein
MTQQRDLALFKYEAATGSALVLSDGGGGPESVVAGQSARIHHLTQVGPAPQLLNLDLYTLNRDAGAGKGEAGDSDAQGQDGRAAAHAVQGPAGAFAES